MISVNTDCWVALKKPRLSLATSSIQNHGSDVISAETVPVVTTDIEVIEVVTIIALPGYFI